MADDNETHFLDVMPSLIIKIEQLHEQDSVNKILEGRQPVDFNVFYNAVILNGVEATAHRLDSIACINDKLVACLKKNSSIRTKITDRPASAD